MKPFKFKLEKYLDVKKDNEDLLMKQLKDIDNTIDGINFSINELDRQEAEEKSKLDKEYQNGIAANELHKYSAFFNYVFESKSENLIKLKEAEQKKEECRESLIKVMNEIKALHKMKEKQFEEYKEGIRLEENKVIDEFVSFQVYSS